MYLVVAKTLARVILAALWLLETDFPGLCPGVSVAHCLITLEFTQMLQLLRLLLLLTLA
jgi:hypothetical protein